MTTLEKAIALLPTKGYLNMDIPQDLNLVDEINRMRKEKNAIILAHYYQTGDIQDISDFLGDSLQLARAAEKTGDTVTDVPVRDMVVYSATVGNIEVIFKDTTLKTPFQAILQAHHPKNTIRRRFSSLCKRQGLVDPVPLPSQTEAGKTKARRQPIQPIFEPSASRSPPTAITARSYIMQKAKTRTARTIGV